MIRYLIDTNICIYIIKNKPQIVIDKLKTILKKHEIGISSITLSELEYSVQKSKYTQQNAINLLRFIAQFDILPYDDRAAKEYGKIRVDLEKQGKIIGNMDMLIGAHAKSRNLTLVTNNEREFKRIKSLSIENWTKV